MAAGVNDTYLNGDKQRPGNVARPRTKASMSCSASQRDPAWALTRHGRFFWLKFSLISNQAISNRNYSAPHP
jgi:hypothetical protein